MGRVAGGMNKRGGHGYGTMAERIAATRAAAAAPPVTPAPTSRGPGALKHCWVDHEHGRLPGLLIEWRRTAAGWQGRVVHPVRDPAGAGWILVEEWLPAAALVQA
jgi:hypothetical protein